MARNKISDLRDHLFATLEGLRDEEQPMDIARAEAVARVAAQIIETAKVEVAFIRATGVTPASPLLEESLDDQPARKALRA